MVGVALDEGLLFLEKEHFLGEVIDEVKVNGLLSEAQLVDFELIFDQLRSRGKSFLLHHVLKDLLQVLV